MLAPFDPQPVVPEEEPQPLRDIEELRDTVSWRPFGQVRPCALQLHALAYRNAGTLCTFGQQCGHVLGGTGSGTEGARPLCNLLRVLCNAALTSCGAAALSPAARPLQGGSLAPPDEAHFSCVPKAGLTLRWAGKAGLASRWAGISSGRTHTLLQRKALSCCKASLAAATHARWMLILAGWTWVGGRKLLQPRPPLPLVRNGLPHTF